MITTPPLETGADRPLLRDDFWRVVSTPSAKTRALFNRNSATSGTKKSRSRLERNPEFCRAVQMIDGLVHLLIQLVHKISVRAEKKVESRVPASARHERHPRAARPGRPGPVRPLPQPITVCGSSTNPAPRPV